MPAPATESALARGTFVLSVAAAAATLWSCRHLPLLDLPQHAAQVALLRDLVSDASPWKSLVQINWFTPYALEYGVALGLSLVFPIDVSFTLLLSISYVGFVAALVHLRRELGGDPGLDWLFVPTFFGFSWEMGFVPFLIACPIGVLFVTLARRHAMAPARGTAFASMVVGVLLFFAHGLVFLLAMAAGALLLVAQRSRGPVGWRHVWPYGPLIALALSYQLAGPASDAAELNATILWGGAPRDLLGRLYAMAFLSFGLEPERLHAAAAVVFLLAPLALGSRLNRTSMGAWVPFVAAVLVYLLAPARALRANYLYQRFAVFLLPTYALLFSAPRAASRPAMRRLAAVAALVAVCWGYLGVRTVRLLRFADETAAIDERLETLPEGKRVLGLAFARASPAAHHPYAYEHYTSWYQARRHGFVDVNFAAYVPQVVRFRPESRPRIPPGTEAKPWQFDFEAHEGWRYDFILVRGATPEAQVEIRAILDNPRCTWTRIAAPAGWTLLERNRCSSPVPGVVMDVPSGPTGSGASNP